MFPPTSPFARTLAERYLGVPGRAARVPDRLRRAVTVSVEPTPFEEAYTETSVTLRRYEPPAGVTQPVPVVVAYAFVNTPEILDLCPDRSVVRQFLARGFAVYVIDWGFPSVLNATLTIDDYVCRYLANCVDTARERADADAVHLFGVSTSSPLVAAYAALFPGRVETLSLQGPPLDFHAGGGMLDFRDLVCDVADRSRDTGGNVPAVALDLAFAAQLPAALAANLPADRWRRLDDQASVDRAARIARWVADGPDLPRDTFRSYVAALVEENALIENSLELGGRAVDLGNVTMPVALVLGEEDAFVPHAASLPFLDAVPSTDTRVFRFPTGHVGTLVGEAAHAGGWPAVVAWLAERS